MRTLVSAIVVVWALPSVVGGQVVCDRFDVKAALRGSDLTVSLDTDLPDNTVVMVSVSRSYWERPPAAEYSIDYLSARSTVGEWRKPKVVSVDHATWRRLLDEKKRVLAMAGEAIEVGRIATDIEVSFTVPIFQDDPRFGPRNSKLRGKSVATTGMRVVRAETKVPYALQRAAGSATAVEYGSYNALRQGVRYRVAKVTPLAPERHPADPLLAVTQIKRMPAGSVIAVISVDRSDASNPWYRVKASGASGEDLGSGWVNSIALIGQDVTVVRP